MTYFPMYLTEYPNKDTALPLHLGLNNLPAGYPVHRHDFLEFSYVVEGEGSEIVNGEAHPMVPGTLTFLLPYQIHEIVTSAAGRLVLYNCRFGMDLLMKHVQDRDQWALQLLDEESGRPPFARLCGAEDERMRRLLGDMLHEYRGREPGREALLKARLTEVLVRFDRSRRAAGSASPAAASPGGGPAAAPSGAAWAIVQHIHTHYQDEELALAQLAQRFKLSVSRISELVKEATGRTFHDYLTDLRIRLACSLLASTELSVAEIAGEVGYSSYKTFSRVFRQRRDLIPTAYRTMIARRNS
ncbi:AraC family transcriptional regulator [Paenibacillus sp. IB182496]|uniref:AraC family transcriptional regulator n=1 Tax=Paenibacillus sabuli TaxID=2772509 RepID=A0A927GTQ4_9BACL|nr:AraC family transcriptional regulator [Paenibacillus sabuli]MBD2847350.1 AraC family transcriptional regulator [Paenibacillus sabuli]